MSAAAQISAASEPILRADGDTMSDDFEAIDKAARDLIIQLARRRAWQDHMASLEAGRQ